MSTGTSVPLPTPSLHPALPHSRLGAPGWAEPRAAGLAWGCSPGGPKPPAWRPVPTWPCSLPMPARCMYKTVGSPSTAAHPQHPWHPHSSPPAAPCSKAAVHSFKHGPIKVGQGERRKALPTPKPPPTTLARGGRGTTGYLESFSHAIVGEGTVPKRGAQGGLGENMRTTSPTYLVLSVFGGTSGHQGRGQTPP